MKRLGLAVLIVTVASGCATSRYGDVDDDVYGSKTRMEYTQQSRAVAEMVEKMLSDPDFDVFYQEALERAAARGHRRPTVIVARFEDNTHPGSNDFETLSQVRRELMTALRKSRKFTVIDLQDRELLIQTSIAEKESGAKDDNLQRIGEYDSGDFKMEGEIQRRNAGKSWFHFLNLSMTDTASGDEAWGDSVRIRKD